MKYSVLYRSYLNEDKYNCTGNEFQEFAVIYKLNVIILGKVSPQIVNDSDIYLP